MSVRLHRIRCSACSGFGVHDGWNTQIARRVLAGTVVEGQTLLVDVDDGKLTFASEPAPLELPDFAPAYTSTPE